MAEKSESKKSAAVEPKEEGKPSTERSRAVDAAILTIEKQFGRGAIMKLGSRERLAIDSIPTGAISLDIALGVGGLPKGRISEIYGPESSGKTTIAQHIIAEAQRRGGVAAFIDVEHALDSAYAAQTGVNVNELLVSQIPANRPSRSQKR